MSADPFDYTAEPIPPEPVGLTAADLAAPDPTDPAYLARVDATVHGNGGWPSRLVQAGEARRAAPPDPWPAPPSDAAFHGLAGRLVDFVNPFTEADRVAVLGTFLAAFGCAVNAGPHARVGPERHPARIFVALVGASSVARKGTSWAPIREIMNQADPEFIAERIVSGLGSGEALVHAVRDPDGDKDPGVLDKRALVFAPEFASILRVMGRQGSILSGIVKEAWDSGRLQNTVKTNPAKATGAHVSIVAHTTGDELARDLSDTDARSGFGNRFIYLAVRRSKLLPSPPPWDEAPVRDLAREVTSALEQARREAGLVRDPEADARWRTEYAQLTRERFGLSGILTSRAEAQVLRLSLVYALLDGSAAIRLPHLEAALALWEYAERSAEFIFGTKTGDPIADRILGEVTFGPVTRTDINQMFGGHVTRQRIEAALRVLAEAGRVRRVIEQTGGRPVERIEPLRTAVEAEKAEKGPTSSAYSASSAPPQTCSCGHRLVEARPDRWVCTNPEHKPGARS